MDRPRQTLAALLLASFLAPVPALAAVVAELGARPVPAVGWTPAPALAVSPVAAAPLTPLAALAAPPALSAAPALQAAPAAGPELPAEAAPPAAEAAPAPAAAAPAPAPALSRARARMRSAARTARALAFLLFTAPSPKSAPVETYLRENQEYALAASRAAVADGALVEGGTAAPTRVTFGHPGLKPLLERADAVKRNALGEDEKLSALRSAVAGALPGRTLRLRALERSRARRGRAVELGDYLQVGGGEREAALVANLALLRAGFKPKLIQAKTWRREGGRVVEEPRTLNLVHTARGQVIFDTWTDGLNDRRIVDATAPAGTRGLAAGISAELGGPRVFTPAGKPKTAGVVATATGEKTLTFSVVGRSAADRLFKEDEQAYQAAAPAEPVTVEWMYFPFYVDGHTALRIGDKLYEFTRRGWRAGSARAFLFNNPYFEAQMARHPTLGIPPFSFGVPLTVAKADAERFAARAAAGRGFFSFWFNNCNQVPFRFLRGAGIPLRDGVFASFSSIRAFRLLLLDPPAQAGAPRLYPLPNQAGSVEPLGPAVPRNLIASRRVLVDLALFVWNWPKFILEKLPRARRNPAPSPAPPK